MTIEQLRKMHQARSFQAFDIHLADGRSLPVDHPEFLAITPPGVTIGVAEGRDHRGGRFAAGHQPQDAVKQAQGRF